MKISQLGEFGLIDRIRASTAHASRRIPVGIGDDAAALTLSPAATLLATTDMLIEGVHFDLAFTDFYSLGWKSAAVNLSDIAAMGGVPRAALTALGIPRGVTVHQVDEFYRGFLACARAYRTALAGGDTCSSPHSLIVSVTMLGEAKRSRIVRRSGARPGDRLFVTGTLGDSAAGLELLRNAEYGMRNRSEGAKKLITRHLRPAPRIEWGRKLAAGIASAMIDVSDGLSSDLGHLCDESGVGADVLADRIPISRELRSVKGLHGTAHHYALTGGEDYELLFTVPPARLKMLASRRIAATEIGRVTASGKLRLLDAEGSARLLPRTGYDHFAGGARRGDRR